MVKIVYSDAFQPKLHIFSTSPPSAISVWPVDGDKWYLPRSILHTGTHPCPPEQSSPCWERRLAKIIIAVISSLGFFCPSSPPPAPSLPRLPAFSVISLLTSQSYVGIKRQRKTITDPLTPISQTLGVEEKFTYKTRTDLLIGLQWAFY